MFDLSPAFSDVFYFVYASRVSLESPMGKQFLPPEEFKSVLQFVESLPTLGMRPLTLTLAGEDFDITFSRGAHLILKRGSDLSLMYSNLSSFLNSESIKAEKDFLEKVTELDLRTENKVFYQFK